MIKTLPIAVLTINSLFWVAAMSLSLMKLFLNNYRMVMESRGDLGFNFGIYLDRTARKSLTLLTRLFKKNKVDLTRYQ